MSKFELVDIVFIRPFNGEGGLAGLISNCIGETDLPRSTLILRDVMVDSNDAIAGCPLKCGDKIASQIGGGWGYINWWSSIDRNEVSRDEVQKINELNEQWS